MEYIAISKYQYAFIVRAGTMEDIECKLDEIQEKYPEFSEKYIRPGYFIFQAESIKRAKQKARENPDEIIYGPLFRTARAT